MQKEKRSNGTITFDLSPQAKSKNGHDDHADVIMMLCDRLYELRAEEATAVEHKESELGLIYQKKIKKKRTISGKGNSTQHFGGFNNPFNTPAKNPFR